VAIRLRDYADFAGIIKRKQDIKVNNRIHLYTTTGGGSASISFATAQTTNNVIREAALNLCSSSGSDIRGRVNPELPELILEVLVIFQKVIFQIKQIIFGIVLLLQLILRLFLSNISTYIR